MATRFSSKAARARASACPTKPTRKPARTILPNADAVFEAADMIVKVKEPQAVEIARLKPDHILFTYLHLAADPRPDQGPDEIRRHLHRL